MGADYSAYAVVGCIIDRSNIPMKKERVKTFKHDYPDNGEIKFDPKTGEALWKTIEYPEFVFADQGDPNPDDNDGKTKVIKLGKLKIFTGTDGKPEVLGVGTGEETYSNGGDDYDFTPLEDVDSIKNRVKEILEPIGLWDEKKFGLYSILYCSY
jgi:hypothetical protein